MVLTPRSWIMCLPSTPPEKASEKMISPVLPPVTKSQPLGAKVQHTTLEVEGCGHVMGVVM